MPPAPATEVPPDGPVGVAATNTASFESSLIPMLVADDQRRYVEVNQAACLLLRLSRADVLKLRIDDLSPLDARDVTAALWEGFIRDGTQSGTFELALPDGTQLRVDYSATANVQPGRHLSLLYFPATEPDDGASLLEGRAPARLTEREREILTLIARGERGASIAFTLGLSPATVETHVRRCLTKLGAKNRAHAIALGLQQGEIAIRLDSSPS
jgi:DNA-binding CsgD family transcriptional regulator